MLLRCTKKWSLNCFPAKKGVIGYHNLQQEIKALEEFAKFLCLHRTSITTKNIINDIEKDDHICIYYLYFPYIIYCIL